MNSNLIVGIIAVSALIVGGINLVKAPVAVTPPVGAVAGPDSSFQTESHNGVTYDFYSSPLRPATTTLCSIKSPNASSTITSATMQITSGNTYSNDYQIGWGLAQGATTTNLARLTLAASNGAAVATTTLVNSFGGGNDGVIPPNSFIVTRVSTTTASATFAPLGACTVTFQRL